MASNREPSELSDPSEHFRGTSVTPPYIPSSETPPPISHPQSHLEEATEVPSSIEELPENLKKDISDDPENALNLSKNLSVDSNIFPCSSSNKSCKQTPPGSPVSDETCPICLGPITDKCVAGSCLHNFCFICLKEWSKQKAVCPLCKQQFTKIIYDIKSETEYKEWQVPKKQPDPAEQNIRRYREFFGGEHERRFFGYRTTIGASNSRRIHNIFPDAIPSGPRDRRPQMLNFRGSSMFRLSIYLNNSWVQPLADITGRYRDTSPSLYREQPALTHRLIPWINRELAALLPSTRIAYVLGRIMELIEIHEINSRYFRREIRPFLHLRTSHFVHELYSFARSPYDMVGHDNAASYIPRYDDIGSNSDTSISDDSDGIVEVDASGDRILFPMNPLGGNNINLSEPNDVAHEETLTNEGSVVISSDSESSIDINDRIPLTFPNSIETSVVLDNIYNPEPPGRLSLNLRHYTNTSFERSETTFAGFPNVVSLDQPGPSGVQVVNPSSSTIKTEHNDDSDNHDCFIINILPPKLERVPELVKLDSESDNDLTVELHHKVKSEKSKRNKHIKKKPRLDRTSFTLNRPLGEPRTASSDNSSNHKEEHSYCSESSQVNIETHEIESIDQPSSSNIDHLDSSSRDVTPDLSESEHDDVQDQSRNKVKSAQSKGSNLKLPRKTVHQSSISSRKAPKKDHHSKVKNSSKSTGTSSHKHNQYSHSHQSSLSTIHCPSATVTVHYPSTSRECIVQSVHKRHVYLEHSISRVSSPVDEEWIPSSDTSCCSNSISEMLHDSNSQDSLVECKKRKQRPGYPRWNDDDSSSNEEYETSRKTKKYERSSRSEKSRNRIIHSKKRLESFSDKSFDSNNSASEDSNKCNNNERLEHLGKKHKHRSRSISKRKKSVGRKKAVSSDESYTPNKKTCRHKTKSKKEKSKRKEEKYKSIKRKSKKHKHVKVKKGKKVRRIVSSTSSSDKNNNSNDSDTI